MPESVTEILEMPMMGATLLDWAIFAGLFVVSFIVLKIALGAIQRAVAKRVDEDAHGVRSIVVKVLQGTTAVGIIALAIAISAGLTGSLPDQARAILTSIGIAVFIIQIGIWITSFMDQGIVRLLTAFKVSEEAAQTAIGVLRFVGMVVVWSILLVTILANLGVQIGPLIAGLGVGGIAIAFALQKILGDIFNSVCIVLDRPFEVGDFIITGAEMGMVERIGIKTTRVRSLSGEMIIIANTDLLDSRIRNYKRMQERRIVFGFGVTYQTPPDKLERIAALMKEIIDPIDDARFDRSHFKGFGASSLDFEVVYYVNNRDFAVYMNVQQQINLRMCREFAEMSVSFAYPTQTLFVEGMPPVQVANAAAAS